MSRGLQITGYDSFVIMVYNQQVSHSTIVYSIKSVLEFELIISLYVVKWIILAEVVMSLRRVLESSYTGEYLIIYILCDYLPTLSHEHCLIILTSLLTNYLTPCLRLPARLIAILRDDRHERRLRDIVDIGVRVVELIIYFPDYRLYRRLHRRYISHHKLLIEGFLAVSNKTVHHRAKGQ